MYSSAIFLNKSWCLFTSSLSISLSFPFTNRKSCRGPFNIMSSRFIEATSCRVLDSEILSEPFRPFISLKSRSVWSLIFFMNSMLSSNFLCSFFLKVMASLRKAPCSVSNITSLDKCLPFSILNSSSAPFTSSFICFVLLDASSRTLCKFSFCWFMCMDSFLRDSEISCMLPYCINNSSISPLTLSRSLPVAPKSSVSLSILSLAELKSRASINKCRFDPPFEESLGLPIVPLLL
mmetsp:Transcript_9338/g.17915  ORF Transcript_9338/g.17915 Transcript_9338/m.17915 type:complete len:235 (-) Transcript_9338:5170-5874(-)